MDIHLDTSQTVTLRDTLDSTLRELRFEIAGTDNARFKAGLRDRERVIRSILEQLRAVVPAQPR
jgi:hypothetical protein